MSVGSISGVPATSTNDFSREESAIRKQIITLKKELQAISSEEGDEKEIAIKKKEIEQQIIQLEQKLQEIKRQENQNRNGQLSTDDTEIRSKEPGKGVYIDEFL